MDMGGVAIQPHNSFASFKIRLDKRLNIIWTSENVYPSFGMNTNKTGKIKCYEVIKNIGEPCKNCSAKKVFDFGFPEKAYITNPDGRKFTSDYIPSFDEKGEVESLYIVLKETTNNSESILDSDAHISLADFSETGTEKTISFESIVIDYLRQFNNLIETHPGNIEAILGGVKTITPSVLDSVGAKIIFDGKNFISDKFANLSTNISCNIVVKDKLRGSIEVSLPTNINKRNSLKLDDIISFLEYITKRICRIIERIETQKELYEEKEWLNTTLSSIGDGIIATDSVGKIKFVNPVAEKMIGVSSIESKGMHIKNVFNIINELDRSISQVPIETVLKGEAVSLSNHTVLLSRDGSEYSISDSFAPIKTMDNVIQGAIINFRDVTSEKKYQKRLQLRESMLDQLLEYMSSGVVVFKTNDNGENFIVNNINLAAERSEKVKREDVVGKNLLEAFKAARGTEFPELLKRVWKTGKTENFASVLRENNIITSWKDNYIYKLPSGEVVTVYKDMTEEKKVQELIWKSEANFRTLAEYSKDIVYRFINFPEQKFEFISPSVEHITGFTQNDFYSNSSLFFERANDDDKSGLLISRVKLLEEFITFRFTRKDGKMIWLESKNTPLYDETGRIITINGVIRDITAQKALENSLKVKKRELEQLISNLPGFVAIYDPEKKQTEYVSKQSERVTGFKRKESLDSGFDWLDRIHEEDREEYESTVNKTLNNQMPYKKEYRFITKSGKCKIFFEQGSVFIDENGKMKLESFTEDVTELRKSERKLIESLKTYDSIFNNKHTPMLIIDPLSHKILEANKASLEFYGYSYEEITKLRVNDINKALLDDLCPLKFDGPDKKSIHKSKHVLADGSVREVVIYCGPVFRDGEELVFSIIHDMTRQNEAERTLKKTLEELQETLSGTINLASKMVELRDPYTAGHQKRVSLLAVEIAKKLELSLEKIEEIRVAALLHDIGKTSVPSELLSKPGKLSGIEMQILEKHPEIAYDLLKEMNFSGSIANIIIQHHERLDGSGYPKGLREKDILFEAKILAVSDVVEAMASHRPYRPAPGLDKAFEELKINSGKLYDPGIVNACLKVFEHGFNF